MLFNLKSDLVCQLLHCYLNYYIFDLVWIDSPLFYIKKAFE